MLNAFIAFLVIGIAIVVAIVGVLEPLLGLVAFVVRYLIKLWRGPIKVEPFEKTLPPDNTRTNP